MGINWRNGIRRITIVCSVATGIIGGLAFWHLVDRAYEKNELAEKEYAQYLKTNKPIADDARRTIQIDTVPGPWEKYEKIGPWKKYDNKSNQEDLFDQVQNEAIIKEFAKKVKEKYPAYADINDSDLVRRVLEKYPVYKDRIPYPEKVQKGKFDPDLYLAQSGVLLSKQDYGLPRLRARLYFSVLYFLGAMAASFCAPWALYFILGFIIKGFVGSDSNKKE